MFILGALLINSDCVKFINLVLVRIKSERKVIILHVILI